MLEKRGGFVVRIFPEGVASTQSRLSQSTQMAYTFSFVVLNVFGRFFVNSTNTHISLSHTVHDKEIWGVCKGMVCRFVPQVWGESIPLLPSIKPRVSVYKGRA